MPTPYAAVPYGMYLGVLCLELVSRCGMYTAYTAGMSCQGW